jgi:hypothetical protein
MPDQYYAVVHDNRGDVVMLLAHALAETSFRPAAKNPETGAAGPYQFLGSTWLDLLMRHGEELGVKPSLVAQIAFDPSGRIVVANPEVRRTLLDLRHDITLSTRLTTSYMDDNRRLMEGQLGRPPDAAEVELSLLLGPRGATRLVQAAARDPLRPVIEVLPRAVSANQSLFQDARGGMRNAADAMRSLVDKLVNYRQRIIVALTNLS